MESNSGLPIFSRLSFYGLCGFFAEIMFNGAWYFFDKNYNFGWTLHGSTSLWAFPIYSICIYMHEQIFMLTKHKINLFFRAFLYATFTFIWEYSTGAVLKYFNACPWDYTEYTYYNVHGLIAFDYCIFWYIGAILSEKVVIKTANSLQYYQPKLKE